MEIRMHVCLLSAIVAAALFHYVKSQGDGQSLLITNKHSIRMVDLETKEYTDIVTNTSYADDIDYHYKKGLIIWSDFQSQKIYSFVLGSSGPVTEIVDVCVFPTSVAVDWIHDNLYWADHTKRLIAVARLDGSLIKTLFDDFFPRGIVIDPFEGLIFWMKGGHYKQIERAGMDGTHRSVIVYRGIQNPSDLTIDWFSQTIYWTDSRARTISMCNYNGTNVRIITSVAEDVYLSPGLDMFGDWLYFHLGSSNRKNVYKTNKHGLGNLTQIIDVKNWNEIESLKVYDSSKQIPGVNRCVNNGGCSHLCLPAPLRLIKEGDLEYTCACPDDVLPSDNCSTIPKDLDTPSTTTVIFNDKTSTHIKLNGSGTASAKTGQSKTNNSFPVTGTIIGISFGLVILALATLTFIGFF